MILGSDGQPLTSVRNGHGAKSRAALGATSYLKGLDSISYPARTRAADPLNNHAWVFAGAAVVAMVASHAAFRVFRETEIEQGKRRAMAERAGRIYARKFGRQRTAIQRHAMTNLERRAWRLAAGERLEPDDEHDVAVLLAKPNNLQNGAHLMGVTFMAMASDGEFFWLKTGKNGTRLPEGGRPQELWPILGVNVKERHERMSGGAVVAWEITRPKWMPGGGRGVSELVRLDEMMVFKGPNPGNIARGLSRLTAAASAIEADMLAKAFQRDNLKRGGTPKGIITYEGELSEAEREKTLRKIREEYEGAEATGRLALLEGKFQWNELGAGIKDMQFKEQLLTDREEILAVLGVPPSMLGSVEFVNYATAMSQRKVFWENTIAPLMRIIEAEVDSGLFFTDPDDVVGMFDVSTVEALMAGLADKINIVNTMCGPNMHVPPRQACNMVGVDIEQYPGDEESLAGGLLTPVSAILDGSNLPDDPVDPPPGAAIDDDEGDVEDKFARAPAVHIKAGKADRIKRWRQFKKLEEALEGPMRTKYRTWIINEQNATLKRFDKATKAAERIIAGAHFCGVRMRGLEVNAVIPDAKVSASELTKLVRPVYGGILVETYDFTADDIGMPTFEIDDDVLVNVFAKREKFFTNKVSKRVTDQLFKQITQGISAGETVEEIRQRVVSVYKFSASKQKSLVIARTEVASAMNGTRDQMFELAGVEEQFWSNAEDEAVRESHVTFGESGSHPRGFNYLTLVGGSGSLKFPNDPDAPAKETIQCRCMAIPA